MATTEAAILERLIEFEQGELPPEAARFFLSWDFPEADRRRLNELHAKAQEGTLTSAEQADLDSYHHVAQLLERVRSRARRILAANSPESASPPGSVDIAPGIRRSQAAFWRDLPELLTVKKYQGQWVCYCGDERIGIARTPDPLIRVSAARAQT